MTEIPRGCPLKDVCKNLAERRPPNEWVDITSEAEKVDDRVGRNLFQIVHCAALDYRRKRTRCYLGEIFKRDVVRGADRLGRILYLEDKNN